MQGILYFRMHFLIQITHIPIHILCLLSVIALPGSHVNTVRTKTANILHKAAGCFISTLALNIQCWSEFKNDSEHSMLWMFTRRPWRFTADPPFKNNAGGTRARPLLGLCPNVDVYECNKTQSLLLYTKLGQRVLNYQLRCLSHECVQTFVSRRSWLVSIHWTRALDNEVSVWVRTEQCTNDTAYPIGIQQTQLAPLS